MVVFVLEIIKLILSLALLGLGISMIVMAQKMKRRYK